MFLETLAVIALITPISATSAWVLRKDVEKIWQSILIYVGPIVDAWLVYYLLNWLEMGFFATWGCTISTGIISSILIQPLFSPQKTRSISFILATSQTPPQASSIDDGRFASSIFYHYIIIGCRR